LIDNRKVAYQGGINQRENTIRAAFFRPIALIGSFAKALNSGTDRFRSIISRELRYSAQSKSIGDAVRRHEEALMVECYKYPLTKNDQTSIAVLVWTVIYLIIVCACLYQFNLLGIRDTKSSDRLFFVLYACAYWGIWTSYLRSGDKRHCCKFWTLPQVYSLRLLLRSESKTYRGSSIASAALKKPTKSAHAQEYSLWKEKAKSSITATTVLATMSFLSLTQFLPGKCEKQGPICDIVINSGRLFSIIATVAFVITVDSLDSLLNDFGERHNDAETHRTEFLMTHFYDRARLARYLGMSALLFCAILLIAVHDFWVACAAIGTIFAIGWNYWFPKLPDTLPASHFPVFFFWVVAALPLLLEIFTTSSG
jgi:hypothetical protein